MRDINSLNKVLLIGRLGGRPEIQSHSQSGRSSARFTLATNERIFNPSTRESRDRTEWHRIVVWFPRLVEFSEKYLDKGRQVLIEGKIRTRDWQDREGNKRTTTEIVADNIVLLGKREDGQPRPGTADLETGGYTGGAETGARPGSADDAFDEEPVAGTGGGAGSDDDIPF
jgi:single-strand DNA-binding protein